MKKILILGAGVYQVPLIKKAKEMGLYTIVCTIQGDYPGIAYADKVYFIDTTDQKEILKIARKENISGICTSGTDVAVRTIAYVCENLGLKGISVQSAGLATDKAKMKDAFLTKGVNTAQFCKVTSLDEGKEAIEEIGLPCVLKIVDKSGSRGIITIQSREELINKWNDAVQATNQDYYIIEKYIEGHEIGVDALVQDGKVLIVLPHDKIMYHKDGITIPIGHVFPLDCSKELLREIRKETYLTIDALKLDNCAVNIDAIIDRNGNVSIIEAGGRCGATGIPELISIHCGVDYYKSIIENALGIHIKISKGKTTACASKLLYSTKDGILLELNYDENKFVEVVLDRKIGDTICKFTNGTNRIGHVIMSSQSLQELYQKIFSLDSDIFISIGDKNE